MIWVGSFQSLRSALRKPPSGAPLEVHTWQRSETGLISPLADWLMSLIARSRCVRGKEEFVELALREAVSNAMLHGNRMDARKLVHVRCCCESTKGVFIVVRDQGSGFDPNNVPNPLAVENLDASSALCNAIVAFCPLEGACLAPNGVDDARTLTYTPVTHSLVSTCM